MDHILSVTAPIYLLIAVGYVAVRRGWMSPADMRVLGQFVAKFCVPALLFRAVSRQSLASVLHVDYLAVYLAASLITLGSVTLFALRVRGRSIDLAAIQGLGAAGSNSAFVGYPIVQQVIGPMAGVALALSMLIENLIVLPLALMLADSGRITRPPVNAADVAAGTDACETPATPAINHSRRLLGVARTTLLGMLGNPMILAILAGLLVSALGVSLPGVLDRTVALAAAAAPPTALFVIGGTLVGLKLSGLRVDLALVSAGKLLLHPLAMLACLSFVPIADPALRAAALLFAAMPMLSIYPVLAQRHGHESFCAAALLTATVASFFTISAVIALLPTEWIPAH